MSHSKFLNKPAIDISNMAIGKRNTSRAVFTSHEREQAKAAWNSTSARLSRDSFLPFASCRLCLQPAVSPVSCLHGDIFCRECSLNNILSQKKEIKRLEKEREKEEKEADGDREREDSEAKQRAVQDFERIQMGLEAKLKGTSTDQKIVGREAGKIIVEEDVVGGKRGEKRKFELDEDELLRIARDERTKARKAIDDEKVCCPIPIVLLMLTLEGLQDNFAIFLGPIYHAFFQHQQHPAHHCQESQVVSSMPFLPSRQTPQLLAAHLDRSKVHRGEGRH